MNGQYLEPGDLLMVAGKWFRFVEYCDDGRWYDCIVKAGDDVDPLSSVWHRRHLYDAYFGVILDECKVPGRDDTKTATTPRN